MTNAQRLRHRHGVLPDPEFRVGDTALLVIDLQYGDAHLDHGLLRRMRDRGDEEIAAYYVDRLETLVIPNVRRLQDACRATGIEVIHTKIESLTADGRDRSLEHKRLNIHHPPGSIDAQFREEVAPVGDEIVLTKTCGGVFNGTNIEYVLRNLGIANLIVAGVITSGCVEVAVRDAADRGFSVTLAEDACASWSEEMEQAAIRAMSEIYAKVLSTDETIRLLSVSAEANGIGRVEPVAVR
jgi:nicotinamidase-related amidase